MFRMAGIAIAGVVLSFAAQSARGAATSFVVPSIWSSAEAPSNNIYPFSTGNTLRLQQLYLGSDMLPGPYQITGDASRRSERQHLR